MKVKVYYVSRYNIPARDGNGRVSGVKVQYQSGGTPVDDASGRGQPVLTVGGDEILWNDFAQVPGLYELDMTVKPDAKGKAVMSLLGARLIQSQQ